MTWITRLTSWLDLAIDYLTISILVAGVAVLINMEGRRNYKYLLASVIFGTVLGVVFQSTPQISSWSYLASLVGAIFGPTTLLAYQKKDAIEILDELSAHLKQKKGETTSRKEDESLE